MKNWFKINSCLLILLGTVLITSSGCSEDFFDKQAGDRISPDKHYKSQIDALVSTQGAIISLQEAMPRFIMLDGLRSDAMDITPYSDEHLREINNHIFNPGNPYTNPADFYKVIININEVLAHIDEVAENDPDFDAYISHFVKGELIGMRAWTYLTLVRLYNQAAFIEDKLSSLPEDLHQDILSKEVMIDTLINQIIPYIFDPSEGTERVELKVEHYVNTKALLGELYLEQGEYALAAEYLKLACESYMNPLSLYKVDKTYEDDGWKSIFMNAETAVIENLSVIPFSSVEDQNNPLASWFGYDYQYMVKPSHVLIDSFMAQVPAAGPLGDPWRGLGITFGVDTLSKESETVFETEAYITKYEIDWSDASGTDIILSRAADLHLMLAEAYNRMGDEDSQAYALMLLNLGVNNVNQKPPEFSKWRNNLGIRGRVFLVSREVPEGLTGEERTRYIEDLIITERSLELAYEGKRWSDLLRVAHRRNDPAYLADKVAAKFVGTPQYDQVHSILMNPENWYLPYN